MSGVHDHGSPLSEAHGEWLTALDALNLPVHDLQKAAAIAQGYGEGAYITQMLDALHAKRALVEVCACDAMEFRPDDPRISALIVPDSQWFVPGRYGSDYEGAAQKLVQALSDANGQDVLGNLGHPESLLYCVMPACEDTGALLHLNAECTQQLSHLPELAAKYPHVRMLVSCAEEAEHALIDMAEALPGIMPRIQTMDGFRYALRRLGLRFIPYSSGAEHPEAMLGRWLRMKEAIWQELCEAYLLLARTGYELTREQIEADAELLFCGNAMSLYQNM